MVNLKTKWRDPPKKLTLNKYEVHVWRAELNLKPQLLEKLKETLVKEERERANRFHFQKDKNHFTAARGVLRRILGKYLKTEPRRLRFKYNAQGKPAIANDSTSAVITFNLSHSHGLALYAITKKHEIGIDVEQIRSNIEVEKIAKRFFSKNEFETLTSLPLKKRVQGFFNCWTRKEAYIKAMGEGLSIPLNQFDVTLLPGETAKILQIRGNPDEAAHWSLYEISPTPGYIGALAVKGHNFIIKYLNWNESLLNSEI